MNLDRVIHEKKIFAELDDRDVETFVRERRFKFEHLNLEFKSIFPKKGDKRYDIAKICKYIVGFSNEDGGLVVYGVADSIKDAAVQFPDYVPGLTENPSTEDLSQWVKERIRPLVSSPAIRFFEFQGKRVAVLKIPSGVNKPYCYYDPSTRSMTFFKKTAAGIQGLGPDEVKEFYRAALIEQSTTIVNAYGLHSVSEPERVDAEQDQIQKHKSLISPKLENTQDYGYLGIHCVPTTPAEIPVEELRLFFENHRSRFSETMRYWSEIEVFQNGVSVGYYPSAIRQDIKSTARITLYKTGFVAFDSQADMLMDKDQHLHPYWLAYELQRHLQLTRAILEPRGVAKVCITVDLDHIENFSMTFKGGLRFERPSSKYSGAHEPITCKVELSEIHAFEGPKRNVAMPIVQSLMDEICRIFGFSKTLPGVWDQEGILSYVRGLEGQR